MQVIAKADWPQTEPRFWAGDVLEAELIFRKNGAPVWVLKRGVLV